ncbi:MAG: DUF4169 family protein [Kiloniellales bacterium]
MSAEIVNLKQAKKAKARAEIERRAAANRVLHGRNKAEREKLDQEAEKRRRLLDGHKLDENEKE